MKSKLNETVTITNLDKAGKIKLLTFNDGNENRITAYTAANILQGLESIECSNAEAMVMTGAGKYFSNGIEINDNSVNNAMDLSKNLYAIIFKILSFPIPTIALINGHAIGAGAMIALANDYRIMNNQRGWVAYPLLKIKLILPPALMELLKSKIKNSAVIRDLVLRGMKLTGTQAEEKGFVDKSCLPEQLLNEAHKLAIHLIGEPKDRTTYAGLKKNLYAETLKLLSDCNTENSLNFVSKL